MTVAPWEVSDLVWERIEPLLPTVKRRTRYPGRKRMPDRQALQGHPLRASHRERMAAPAAGAGLRLRLDLLPPP